VGKALYSECEPTQFKSGTVNDSGGKWHGRFEKTFPTVDEIRQGMRDNNNNTHHYLNRDTVLALLESVSG